MANLTAKQKKTVSKITEAIGELPFGASLSDIFNKTGISLTTIKNTLSSMDNVEKRGGEYFLKSQDEESQPEIIIPKDGTYDLPRGEKVLTAPKQAEWNEMEFTPENTSIDQPVSPTNLSEEIANPSDMPVNPSIGDEEQPSLNEDEKSLINTDTDQIAKPNAFLVIETCALSLAQDGTGQEPVGSKCIWVDECADLEIDNNSADGRVLNLASEGSKEVKFLDMTYRKLIVVDNTKILHGVYYSFESAIKKRNELLESVYHNIDIEVVEV